MTTSAMLSEKEPDDGHDDNEADEEEEDCCIEDLYKLDFEEDDEEERPIAAGGEVLKPGMHVYIWCSFGSYQHHGIVLQADPSSKNILIAEFTNAALAASDDTSNGEASSGGGGGMSWMVHSASTSSHALSDGVLGGFRLVIEDNPSQWHVVKYQASAVESLTWRAGTCSGATPDSVDVVLARVRFLADCCHLIPKYHVLASNCEALAVWCVTGRWETLQGGNALNASKVGSGLLLLAESALFVPLVGVATGAAAVWHSMHIVSQWEQTTTLLNEQFRWHSMGKQVAPRWNLEGACSGVISPTSPNYAE